MTKEITELLKALTELANTTTAYVLHKTVTVEQIEPISTPKVAPAKKKATKKKSAPTVQDLEPQPIDIKPEVTNGKQANGANGMSEQDSAQEVLEVAKAFAMRFQKSTPPGVELIRAKLKENFTVGKLGDLVHVQRMELIDDLKKEMERPV